MAEQIHIGDVGTNFEVTVMEDSLAKDLSTATSVVMRFRRPNNSVVEKNATFVNSGIDGKVHYISESGFLNVRGPWDLQVVVTFPGGNVWHTDIVNFHVHPNI